MITHLAAAAASCNTGTWRRSGNAAGTSRSRLRCPRPVTTSATACFPRWSSSPSSSSSPGPRRGGRRAGPPPRPARGPAMTEAAQRKAVAKPPSRLPVSGRCCGPGSPWARSWLPRPCCTAWCCRSACTGSSARLLTAVLIVALAVVLAELTRRHHRTVAGHAIRHGKRGAVATARHARRHGGTALQVAGGEGRSPLGEPGAPAPDVPQAPRRGRKTPPRKRPRKRKPPAPGTAPDAPPPDSTPNGGTTSMTVSKIAPERRARRTAARTGGNIPPRGGRSSPRPPTSSPKTTASCSTG